MIHLGKIKTTMTMVQYSRTTKCLRTRKKIKKGRAKMRDRKEKLKKILKVNLRLSAYMTKLKE